MEYLSILGFTGGTFFFPGFSHSAFMAFNCVGAFHTTVVHSGWYLPFFPDPKSHFIHHHSQLLYYPMLMKVQGIHFAKVLMPFYEHSLEHPQKQVWLF